MKFLKITFSQRSVLNRFIHAFIIIYFGNASPHQNNARGLVHFINTNQKLKKESACFFRPSKPIFILQFNSQLLKILGTLWFPLGSAGEFSECYRIWSYSFHRLPYRFSSTIFSSSLPKHTHTQIAYFGNTPDGTLKQK